MDIQLKAFKIIVIVLQQLGSARIYSVIELKFFSVFEIYPLVLPFGKLMPYIAVFPVFSDLNLHILMKKRMYIFDVFERK